jgi:polyhydroxybutyrate depolymerase
VTAGRRGPRVVAAAVLCVALAGCGDGDHDAPPATTAPVEVTAPAGGSAVLGPDERPARLVAPDEVEGRSPLLVLLHGFGGNADLLDRYLGVTEQARSRGLYVLLPGGTAEAEDGDRFWDAMPACCNDTGAPVDDVGYLRDLIDEAVGEHGIDPTRVYVFGHSNGGFMAYRLACDVPGIAAIAVLAGSDVMEERSCPSSTGASVLHLHGTADQVIDYEGGVRDAPYPGAATVVARWAERAGCDAEPVEGPALDLDAGLDGAETTVDAFDGCDGGVAVQLDTIVGGGHIPALDPDAVGVEVLDWLLDRRR